MKKNILIIFISILFVSANAQNLSTVSPEYSAIKKELKRGWNTWNTRNVLSQVLLPYGLEIKLGFKQIQAFDQPFLHEALIGRQSEDAPVIIPGAHSYDGSYQKLEIKWKSLHAYIETAAFANDLFITVTPINKFEKPINLVIEAGMLWNMPGSTSKTNGHLTTNLPNKKIEIYCSESQVNDFSLPINSPYLVVELNKAVGICTIENLTSKEIQQKIDEKREEFYNDTKQFGKLAEANVAVQSGIAWNLIYEPKFDRVVATVGRLWNEEYGGFCLFGWDNFFLAYMTALNSKSLAFANVIEHIRGITDDGFIPNDNAGNGRKTWDHSQPPVGSIMVKEIYKKYPEKWFLETVFDDLLRWNRWWWKNRMNEGLLSYGSSPAKNPFNEWARENMQAAKYESGMDDSPMYVGVVFNKEKHTMELQDVGLNGLYIADCNALIEMAEILNRDEIKELKNRAATLTISLKNLWNEEQAFYLNFNTKVDTLSKRISPTLFYPLMAAVPSNKKAKQMLNHFYIEDELGGEYILPSIARNDILFEKQRYWKGAIWPPLNFLTYLSFREAGFKEAASELAEKSLKMFISEWKRKGYVSENYSAITGTGDDPRLSSDRFHSWGSLFGIMSFMEADFLPPFEKKLDK